MEKNKLYVAYGSNLNLEQMAYRCPTATPVCAATLSNHRLLFRGSRTGSFATIEPCMGMRVPVLAWKVQASDVEALDRYEGFPHFYGKETLALDRDGVKVSAFVYVMTEGRPLGMPSQNYIHTIREGYRSLGFDQSVLEEALEYTSQQIKLEQEQKVQYDDPFYSETYTHYF